MGAGIGSTNRVAMVAPSSAATSQTTGSFTATAGDWYVMCVFDVSGSATVLPTVSTTNGLTFNLIAQQSSSSNLAWTLWTALCSSTATGTVTVIFDPSAAGRANISIDEISGTASNTEFPQVVNGSGANISPVVGTATLGPVKTAPVQGGAYFVATFLPLTAATLTNTLKTGWTALSNFQDGGGNSIVTGFIQTATDLSPSVTSTNSASGNFVLFVTWVLEIGKTQNMFGTAPLVGSLGMMGSGV